MRNYSIETFSSEGESEKTDSNEEENSSDGDDDNKVKIVVNGKSSTEKHRYHLENKKRRLYL